MNSVAKLPYEDALDGISNTQTINPGALGHDDAERTENLVHVLDGYFKQGAHHLNVNVFGKEKLIDAMEHPEKEEYANFTIRVSGPGVRYVIFLSGCAMRCQFCHNPDTWNMTAGKSYTADALLKQAVKYRTYWGNKGGITVSGGEPLLQIDFLIELFRKAKEMGIHTTLDTSGNPYTEKEPFYSKWLELMKYTDLILLDIKHIDEQEHIKLTGQTNKNILAMAEKLSDMGKPVWIRHVLVPERSDRDDYLHRLADFIHTLKNVERVEVLPYHTLGVFKWENLGIPYQLEEINPPSAERIKNAEEILAFRK